MLDLCFYLDYIEMRSNAGKRSRDKKREIEVGRNEDLSTLLRWEEYKKREI